MIEIFAPGPWQMTLGERAALEGVLCALAPALSIEIGTAQGGSLRRIATHSGEVHSFDLVEPTLPVAELGNVTLHTGDSHALLPEFLGQLAEQGRNVDFVLVDGDHSADGVAKDLEDLLASPAIRRTAILIHDTSNDEVRRGVERVPFEEREHVVGVDLDFVAGHLSHGGDYHHALWGGLGLVVVDADGERWPARSDGVQFYTARELFATVRDGLVAAEESGVAVEPGALPALRAPGGDDGAALQQLERERDAALADAEQARAGAAALERSLSWRLTAPLRAAKRAGQRRRGA
jgi:Methyltransferase domain